MGMSTCPSGTMAPLNQATRVFDKVTTVSRIRACRMIGAGGGAQQGAVAAPPAKVYASMRSTAPLAP